MKNLLRKTDLFSVRWYQTQEALGPSHWAYIVPLEAILCQTAGWPTWCENPRWAQKNQPAKAQLQSVESPSQPLTQSPWKIPFVGWEQGQSAETYCSALCWQHLNCQSRLTSHRDNRALYTFWGDAVSTQRTYEVVFPNSGSCSDQASRPTYQCIRHAGDRKDAKQ